MPCQVRALVDHFLVPREAEPLHALEDGAGAFVGAAGLVGVLDAEEELPTVSLDVEPVEERGSSATDVQVAGGRGREAETRRTHDAGPVEKSRARRAWRRALIVHGEGGIRTLDTGVNPYNGLANRRLQPLGHLSNCKAQLRICRSLNLGGGAGWGNRTADYWRSPLESNEAQSSPR